MKPTTFTTADLKPDGQAEAWRAWFDPVFDIAAPEDEDGSFPATNFVWNLGPFVISRISAPATLVERTRSNIARAPVDHWVLSCCRAGDTTMETKGRNFSAPAGLPYLWSLVAASRCKRSQTQRIQLILPRDSLPTIAPQMDMLCGTALHAPSGRILGEYLLALDGWLPAAPPETMPYFANAIREMVLACVQPSAENAERAKSEFDNLQMARVRKLVHVHLKSPKLDPEHIGRMAGLSRSGLYRLFEASGGVARYIRRERLLSAHASLADPANLKSILQIAEDLCFADLPTFSRAFRREFGCTPSDLRAAARQPHRESPSAVPVPAGAGSFGVLLGGTPPV